MTMHTSKEFFYNWFRSSICLHFFLFFLHTAVMGYPIFLLYTPYLPNHNKSPIWYSSPLSLFLFLLFLLWERKRLMLFIFFLGLLLLLYMPMSILLFLLLLSFGICLLLPLYIYVVSCKTEETFFFAYTSSSSLLKAFRSICYKQWETETEI